LTHAEYDRKRLVEVLSAFGKRYAHLNIYLEPSEAVVHRSGVLIATVLDLVHNGMDIAILDLSVEVHMIDVMVSKMAPEVRGSSPSGRYCYQLAGVSCAAGDIVGHYCFEAPLAIGQQIIFENQMHYSMVKATAFNGINPASIAIKEKDGSVRMLKVFGYEDYIRRL